ARRAGHCAGQIRHSLDRRQRKGLIRFDGKTFSRFAATGKVSSHVWALWPDSDGSLWVGTQGNGLIHVAGSEWQHLPVSVGRVGDVILALAGDRDGNIWIGTDGAGLYRYHAGRMEAYNVASGLSGDIVRTVLED